MWPKLNHLGLVPAESRRVKPMPSHLKGLVPMPVDNIITVKPTVPDVEADTMPLIINKAKRTAWQTKKLAAKLKGPTLASTLRNDSKFILDYIRYVKDDPEHEQVRSPRRLVHEGKGDCDCFAVLLASLLINQKINFWFRIARYPNSADWSHIYVVVPHHQKATTMPTDRSQYTVLDPVTNQHNYEVKFTKKKDFPMSLQYLDGFGSGSLGACDPAQSTTAAIEEKSTEQIKALRRYVLTTDVVRDGLVPTRDFLRDKGFSFTEKVADNKGYFEVATPAGPVAVSPIITQDEAKQLEAIVAAPAPEVLTASVEQPKQAGMGIWTAVGLAMAALGSIKPTSPGGLSGVKRTTKKRRVVHI